MILSSYKFLHIFDDAIISIDTIQLFLKLNDYDQQFAIITSDKKKWEDIGFENSLILIDNNKNCVNEILAIIVDFDIIIMQALSFEKAKAISKIQSNNKVLIWALWGYELYNIVNYYSDNHQEFSTVLNKKSWIQKIKDYYTFKIIYKKAISKIDISLFLLKKDFELLSSCIPNTIIWKEGCYQTINNLTGEFPNNKSTGNSILVGNSSTPSNRHNIAIEKLSNIDLKNRKVIVPLSYGDDNYREQILNLGNEKFQSNFTPLIDFISRESYTEILSSCSHAIFAHERQQAFGSILTMLLLGTKVFLSETNPLFSWFQSKNIIIYNLEQANHAELLSPLIDESCEHNRKQLETLLSETRILEQLNSVLLDSIDLLKRKRN